MNSYSKFLRGSYPVNSSDIPLKPTPVITGPDTLSSCGNLTLSGSQSFGGGGRSLKFVWSLISPGSGDDVTEIQLANFLNASSFEEVTHSIIKATVPVPALMLSSNIRLNKGEVFVSEDLSIRTIGNCDRQIGQDSGAIKLEAKLLTVDPDQTSHALSCNWSCELQGGGSCVSVLDSISNCVTEVQSNLFLAGKTYKIRFWLCKPQSLYPIAVFNPGNNSFVLLTLPKGLLTPCSKYRFKLTVDDGSEVGVASLDVEVRTGPTSGSLSVEPMSVKALDTVTLSALQWTSAPDAVPLRYVFGVLVEEDVCDRSPPDPNDLTPDAINSLLRNAVEAPLQSGNVDAVVGALSSIIVTVQDSNDTTDELKSNISKKTQEVIVDIVGSAVIDQDIALPLLTTLIKTDAKAADNSSIVAQAAVTILKRLGDKPLTDEKARRLFKVDR
ncbi:hypothetical protein OS493_031336 [Desmophyllum pertusum]|uniref:PKD/REJ-like domain-containing protein n=1 Tax=Desmophyllum pertusum TaxID=174260 RepID=A0A9W9YWE3_9CNID|nr:hypothetical protein OS493_031336 [Desmophyllum pertusum]